MKKLLGIAIASLGCAFALGAGAAQAADKPIRLVIFAAGGPVDFVARQFADKLSKATGTDVIVEAKPGANGIIAAQHVISTEPDGTTLFFSSSGLFTISPIFQKLPFDIDRDLVPVSRIVINASAVAIDANIPAKTVGEFIAYAKAKKQAIDFGSPGVGNITQLWIEQFADATGLQLMAVPYKGIAPVMVDVMGGRLAGTIGDLPAFLPHINSGRMRVIGLVGETRNPAVPNIPTVHEQGYQGLNALSWYGVFASSKTPTHLVQKLNTSFKQVLSEPSLRDALRAAGVEPAASTPAELAALVQADRARWATLIQQKQLKME
jgi:tripartite-type tricarboxylate transporter receptor subunit TctC